VNYELMMQRNDNIYPLMGKNSYLITSWRDYYHHKFWLLHNKSSFQKLVVARMVPPKANL